MKSAKHQTPNAKKTPTAKLHKHAPKARSFGAWSLVVLWCLVFGVWCLLMAGCGKATDSDSTAGGSSGSSSGKKLTIALMPKSKGNAYFISCKKGADKAAAELGVELIFDGPTDPDPARQNEIIENWIALGVDVIAA